MQRSARHGCPEGASDRLCCCGALMAVAGTGAGAFSAANTAEADGQAGACHCHVQVVSLNVKEDAQGGIGNNGRHIPGIQADKRGSSSGLRGQTCTGASSSTVRSGVSCSSVTEKPTMSSEVMKVPT